VSDCEGEALGHDGATGADLPGGVQALSSLAEEEVRAQTAAVRPLLPLKVLNAALRLRNA